MYVIGLNHDIYFPVNNVVSGFMVWSDILEHIWAHPGAAEEAVVCVSFVGVPGWQYHQLSELYRNFSFPPWLSETEIQDYARLHYIIVGIHMHQGSYKTQFLKIQLKASLGMVWTSVSLLEAASLLSRSELCATVGLCESSLVCNHLRYKVLEFKLINWL